jgi:hypothetical protein
MFPYCKHMLLVPPKCLGLRLAPFSLGHVDLLTALEHPVAVGSPADMTTADLAVAVWVCSRSSADGARLFRSGRAVKEVYWLGRRLTAGCWDLGNEWAVFLEYLETYLMAPPRWEPEKEAHPVIPWHLSVFAALQRDLKYSPAELWDMPLPRALELFAAVAANRGDDSLVSLKEQIMFEAMETQGAQAGKPAPQGGAL